MRASHLVAGLAGLVFGLGLLLSGMTHPERVLDFLDFAGDWNPSLAFVMGTALLVHAPLGWLVRRGNKPQFSPKFHLPTRRDIDRPLVVGALIFGAGWGLAGFCPGPGLVSAVGGSADALVFVIAMTLGMFAQQKTERIVFAPLPIHT